MKKFTPKLLLAFCLIVLYHGGCSNYNEEEGCHYAPSDFTCNYRPDYGTVTIKVSTPPDNSPVPIWVYRGNVDDGELIFQDYVTEFPYKLYDVQNGKISVKAGYIVSFKGEPKESGRRIDGGELKPETKEYCEGTCYREGELTLDVHWPNDELTKLLSGDEFDEPLCENAPSDYTCNYRPDYGTVTIYGSTPPDNSPVPIWLYRGNVDDGELILQEYVTEFPFKLYDVQNGKISIKAGYVVSDDNGGEVSAREVDNGELEPTSKEFCEGICYREGELTLDIQWKSDNPTELLSGDEFEDQPPCHYESSGYTCDSSPGYGTVTIYGSTPPDSTPVPVRVYKGNVHDGELIFQDYVTEFPYKLYDVENGKITVSAGYIISYNEGAPEPAFRIEDGELAPLSKEFCEGICYKQGELTLDVHWPNDEISELLSGDEFDEPPVPSCENAPSHYDCGGQIPDSGTLTIIISMPPDSAVPVWIFAGDIENGNIIREFIADKEQYEITLPNGPYSAKASYKVQWNETISTANEIKEAEIWDVEGTFCEGTCFRRGTATLDLQTLTGEDMELISGAADLMDQ